MPAPHTEIALWLLALAAALGLFLTRLARGVATHIGMVDSPDGHRKKQTRPVPVAGGVAVFAAALAALCLGAAADPGLRDALLADPRKTFALLAAAALITVVGFADDRYNLRARYKLCGQLAAILMLVVGGHFVVGSVGVFGWTVVLGPFAVPATALWLLACVNALNLIDGMDGLLGTVGGIALVTLAVMAYLTGNVFAASVALALAGAVFGFLWWNLPPATVYMGDAGSMLIGLVVGAVAIPASLKGPATVALGAPLAVLILPAFDTAAAVVRRKLTGRGLATADRGHLHHKLMERGLTPSRVLAVVAVLGLVAAGGALATTAWNNDMFALVAGSGVVLALLAGRLFGNAELGLIRARVSNTVRGLWAGVSDPGSWGLAVRLQGTADWDRVWGELVARAGRLRLQGLCLDVNAPAMHENFHARWSNPALAREERVLRMVIPLFGTGGVSLGQLTLALVRDARPLGDVLASFAGLVEVIEQGAAALCPAPEVAPPTIPALVDDDTGESTPLPARV